MLPFSHFFSFLLAQLNCVSGALLPFDDFLIVDNGHRPKDVSCDVLNRAL